MLIVSQVLDPVFICSPWEMSLRRKRISVLLFLDLLCQVTGQKIPKSPGHVSQNLLSSNSSVGNGVQTFFPCFSWSCPDLPFFPLTFSSGSSLQRCYLRVILLFSLICKHLHASWAANSKEVQLSRASGEQNKDVMTARMQHAANFGQLHCVRHVSRNERKTSYFPQTTQGWICTWVSTQLL